MVRFRRTVKGILAVRIFLICHPITEKVTANTTDQACGKCHLKLKNEKKTLGRNGQGEGGG